MAVKIDRVAAKKAGYTDAQIDQYISREEQGQRATQINQPVQQQEAKQPGILSKILGLIASAPVNIAQDISAAGQVKKQLPQQEEQAQKQLQGLQIAKQAAQTTDPAEKERLLNLSRQISAGVTNIDTSGFSKDIERGYLDRGLEAGVQMGLMATPFLGKLGAVGKGVQTLASKAPVLQGALTSGLKSGAVGGALLGATQEGNLGDRATAALKGGAIGGAIGGAFDVAGKAYTGIKNIISKASSQKASQAFTKATPSAFNKIVLQHGKDVDDIARKYVPSGANYDDMLGPVSKRGSGGVIGQGLKDAEQLIQETSKTAGKNFRIEPKDLLKNLKEQRRLISQEIGGGARVKALDLAIKQVENKYKNGASLTQALETLRYANQKFGENVVKTKASDAIAGAVQKAEANALRSTVKSIFPDIADALDTQSDLLVLKPILNKARSTMSTQGSKIRVGRSVMDIVDYPFQKPSVASKLMQGGQPTIFKGAGNLALPTSLLTRPYTQEAEGGALPQEELAPQQIEQPQQAGMVITPEQMQQIELSSKISSGTKERIRKAYDIQTKQNKPLSSVAAEKVGRADRAMRALDGLEKEWSQEKTLLAMIPGAPGAQLYRRNSGEILDVIGYMSTGAAIDKNQRKDYEYFLPTPLDNAEIVKQKISQLRQMFQEFASSQRATAGSFDLQQQ